MTQLLKRKTVKELSEELFRIENNFLKFEEVIQNLNQKVETMEKHFKESIPTPNSEMSDTQNTKAKSCTICDLIFERKK